MKKGTFFTVGVFVLGNIVCAPLMAERTVSLNSSVEMVIPSNACTSQPIALHGTVHMFINYTSNANSFHFEMHTNTQDVTGVGLVDGMKYNLVNGSNINVNSNTNSGSQMEMMLNGEFDLIGQGSAPNQRARFVIHVTTDANGNVTADFVKGSTICN
jgi:hypothetical protein